MDLYTIAGLAGVVTYVAAYGALQAGLIDGNGVNYSVANVLAASLVLISLTSDFNLASAVIQVVWITIGVGGLAIRFVRNRNTALVPPAEPDLTPLPQPSVSSVGRITLNLRPDRVTAGGAPSLGLLPDSSPA